MWHLDNRTPYAADYTWGRDKEGVHEWIVAVKATYHIQPDGALILAEEQLPPSWHRNTMENRALPVCAMTRT